MKLELFFIFLLGLITSSFSAIALEDEFSDIKESAPVVDSSSSSNSPANGAPQVKYEYKKEDYFDFDALSIKGELISPGDLSDKLNKRLQFNPKKYIRKNFDEQIVDDLLEIY